MCRSCRVQAEAWGSGPTPWKKRARLIPNESAAEPHEKEKRNADQSHGERLGDIAVIGGASERRHVRVNRTDDDDQQPNHSIDLRGEIPQASPQLIGHLR